MKDAREIAPDMENAGYPLDKIATAGQPEQEHFERLAEASYKTVVDMRMPEEDRGLDEPEIVRWSGMEYVSIPVGHETVEDETFERFRELMRNPERRPMLVHCSSANRVGALLIPYLVLDEGKTPEEAVEMATEVGLKSDQLKQAALRYVGVE
ncbi:MAG TPA: protein tyrosine phosphatase family protein [Rubrobacteraceae bacterium]|nr:protein tyrosine phosphatase family protein [Rubrobacteraceae bacterium]